MTVTPLRRPTDTSLSLADLTRLATEARRERANELVAALVRAQELCAEIVDDDGELVGVVAEARRLVAPLNGSELNLRALIGRKEKP